MPKEAFGGDDEEGEGAEIKRLDLSKYGLAPDKNIRDIFWNIMASYSATKKPGTDLSLLRPDRFALMRVALSVLSRPNQDYGLSPRFIARYTLMMLIDAGWEDALMKFLEKSSESMAKENVGQAVKNLLLLENYRELIGKALSKMLRNRETLGTALNYIAESESRELAEAAKQELIILARGDIGTNQLNAIRALSQMKDDAGAKKAFLILLSHWDERARLAAARALLDMKDGEVKKAAQKRLAKETSQEVQKVLERLAK
ncbi:hypothetical protein GF318_00945 [Candidatus Micrarchaeota archaeon]|nr:hypothetical protein [Candidatus Micrarchaeota archaeon]